MNKKYKIILSVLLALLLIFGLLAGLFYRYVSTEYTAEVNEEKVEIVIPKGATFRQISDTLFTHHLIADKKEFAFWAKILGDANKLKAGCFSVPLHLNYPQLLSFFKKAKPKEIRVTLIEGWSNERIAEALEKKFNINREKFISLTKDSIFIHKLGVSAPSLCGYLLPNTYRFYWGASEESLLKRLVNHTLKIFEADSVRKALKKMNLSIHQILTMASIVEGEAIYDDERPIIASVYYNRLRRHMKLQADPTIQYILDGPPRRVLLKDLKIESPYNTYLHYGLPPGPINNPGKSSILAAIFPAKTRYLFFAAKGDGRHKFSVTANEHAKAHAELNRLRRIEWRKRRLKKDSDL